jgi:hypothetical protein
MPCQFGIYNQKQSANSIQNARCDHHCFFVMEKGIDQAVGISKAMAYGSCKLRNTERKGGSGRLGVWDKPVKTLEV